MRLHYSTVLAAIIFASAPVCAQLSIITQFNPSNTGGTCGVAYNAPAGQIMVIGCSAATIDRYAEDGTFISSANVVGEGANDVDVDMAPVDLFLNGTFVQQGRLLLINGETDVAEIYAINEVTNEVIDTLVTAFGVSHVVGGSYHPQRGTFFLVQDNVPGAAEQNRVAEIDPTTGAVIQSFSILPEYNVNYGDLDISPVSGHLFLVSSIEGTIAEFTPEGVFVTEYPLPTGVSGLSGIALDNDLDGAWVCNTSGVVFKLGNFPMDVHEVTGAARSIVHPNPASDQLSVILQQGRTLRSASLIDPTGREVKTLGANGATTLDLQGVPPGRYVLLIHLDNVLEAHGLVIMP